MSSLKIVAGLTKHIGLPNSQVILIGKNKLLKALKLENDLAQKLVGIDDRLFSAALKQLSSSGSVPLYLDLAKIISVPDDYSRHNNSANSNSIFKALKGHKIPDNVENLSIILYANYDEVMASVAAVAKSFPLYSLKTSKTEKNKTHQGINVEVVVSEESKSLGAKDIAFLQNLCESIRLCTRLIDTPANFLTTDALADEALAQAEMLDVGIKKTIIKGDELLRQGFGGIYHVGKAALNPPIFVCLSHTPDSAKESYALVGKGIVYDTGGMQIKGKESMPSMKNDMGGAAACLAGFLTLVKSGFRENLHCLLCIAENNISPAANKPSDIITQLSGKTVEIVNTDAEGRLVLADGVFYAKNTLKANTIIDMATLTGAQSWATGRIHAAILTNKEKVEIECIKAGRKSGDMVHPLPYAPDLHFSDLKSTLADMNNANFGKKDGPPSAIAGLFIGAHIDFSDEVDWLHIDMAALGWDGERGTGYGPALIAALLAKHTPDVAVAQH